MSRSSFFRVVQGWAAAMLAVAAFAPPAQAAGEDRPGSVRVEATDEMGSVFADAAGKTLYVSGIDQTNQSKCDSTRHTYIRGAGSLSYHLPDPDKRRTCQELWPPFLASADAKPVGAWTLIKREDGARHWALNGRALYTFMFDGQPGAINGLRDRSARYPAWVALDTPGGILTVSTDAGRVLMTDKGRVLYVRSRNAVEKAACAGACLQQWKPLAAPQVAEPIEGWSITAAGPDGRRQWAYQGKPLFIDASATTYGDLSGAKQPGWRPATLQPPLAPPTDFSIQMTGDGKVFADDKGMTVYTFICAEESPDRALCDVPGASPVYFRSICGPAETCASRWRPVRAPKGAKPVGRTWSIVTVDPTAAHQFLAPGQTEGVQVWAYRGMPVYTFSGDAEPGDMNGQNYTALGQWGFKMVRLPGSERAVP